MEYGLQRDSVRILVATAAAYVLVFFILAPGNSIVSYPVHHDDYNNLSIQWPPHAHVAPLSAFPPRPVSYYLLALLSSLGIPTYYTALHALTLGYVWGILCIVRRALPPSALSWPVTFAAAATAFGIENAIEYSKYTGPITSLSSGFFAVMAILAMFYFQDRKLTPAAVLLTVALAGLSLFAKEDFPIPILLAAAWIAWSNRSRPEAARWFALLAAMLAVVAAAVVYNRLAASPFTLSTHGTYKPDFSPGSVLRTSWLYLTQTPAAAAIAALQSIALAALVLRYPRLPRDRALLLHSMAIGPLLPYACLPHHMTFYYPFLWTAWQAPVALLMMARMVPARGGTVVACCACAAVLAISQPGRAQTARFYKAEAARNIRMVRLLRTYRSQLRSYGTVAVEGAPVLGPWYGSDGAFLANRYGLDHTWIVRTPRDSDYFRGIVGLLNTTVQGRVRTVASEEPHNGSLPLVRLNPDGSGSVLLPAR